MIAGTPDARAVAWVKNGYCALAVGKDGSYAAGYAATLPEARANALKKCSQRTTNCEIVGWAYSGRPQGAAKVEGGDETTANVRRVRQ